VVWPFSDKKKGEKSLLSKAGDFVGSGVDKISDAGAKGAGLLSAGVKTGVAALETGGKTITTGADILSDATFTAIEATFVPEMIDIGLSGTTALAAATMMGGMAGYDLIAGTTEGALDVLGIPSLPRVEKGDPVMVGLKKIHDLSLDRGNKTFKETFQDGLIAGLIDEDEILEFKENTDKSLQQYKDFVDKQGNYIETVADAYKDFDNNLNSGMSPKEAGQAFRDAVDRVDNPSLTLWDYITLGSLGVGGAAAHGKRTAPGVAGYLSSVVVPRIKKVARTVDKSQPVLEDVGMRTAPRKEPIANRQTQGAKAPIDDSPTDPISEGIGNMIKMKQAEATDRLASTIGVSTGVLGGLYAADQLQQRSNGMIDVPDRNNNKGWYVKVPDAQRSEQGQ